MSFYLAIVSPLDTPLFEAQFASSKGAPPPSASTTSFPSWSSFSNGGGESSAPSTPGAGGGAPPGTTPGLGGIGAGSGEKHILQMVAHASLDAVEEVSEGTASLYLKAVDRHNEWTVSAFIASNVKFILLHDTKNDDGIRLFFGEVWELYVKAALNPFQTVNTPIRNPAFDTKVRVSAKRYL
ncbi:putative trafficking protein particle complex subunit 2 [Vanrija pseudolonga]|uniref:Trafficking protein particle complex subunit 2 n=1 Tax=Vanrija pseudolonga TaxID=143232 RepID=A0AAF1BL68_9TREE|nr:putative trafficking protein particle complex subunit 2 [Vanrija pseudolonga]